MFCETYQRYIRKELVQEVELVKHLAVVKKKGFTWLAMAEVRYVL